MTILLHEWSATSESSPRMQLFSGEPVKASGFMAAHGRYGVQPGTAGLFGLYCIVTLLAQHLLAHEHVPLRNAAGSAKPLPTFSEAVAAVRRWLWSHAYSSLSPQGTEMVNIPRPLVERFVNALC